MAKVVTKNSGLIVLVIILALQFGLIGWLWGRQNNMDARYNSEIDSLSQNITSANNGLAYQPVTVSPSEKKIYLPQINLSLPLTTLGTSLVYSPDTAYVAGTNKQPNGPLDEASISTFSTASAAQSQTQFDCSSVIRIKFEPKPSPYNPSEIPSGSVPLANGKILQIYANHLKNCQLEWSMTKVDPDAVAALFKQAQSY
ncbi:MAG TPA: hypothetical protein VFP35_02965 [Candidatus Saccharimonadales bacterium]|nr:hypothetical protein [Candidatus Saccharimonadales bacterium]